MTLLDNRVAIISGASRGIGQAVAKAFVREGARVVLTAQSDEVETVASSLGDRAIAMRGDITDDAHAKSLVMNCRERFGGLDILVNNAGILNAGLLGMTKLDDVRSMFEVNVYALINLTQYAIRLMGKSPNASVINLSSIAGTQGIEGISAYSASKAAVAGFTRSAAKELAPKGIRMNAIAPGFIDTDMARQVSDDWFHERTQSIRMGRIGKPHEIADCAVYLASDLATHVTGQIIGVDGGMVV